MQLGNLKKHRRPLLVWWCPLVTHTDKQKCGLYIAILRSPTGLCYGLTALCVCLASVTTDNQYRSVLFYLCFLPAGCLSGICVVAVAASATASSDSGPAGGMLSGIKTWGWLSACRRSSELSRDSISSRRLSLLTRSARHGAPTLMNLAWHPTACINQPYTFSLYHSPYPYKNSHSNRIQQELYRNKVHNKFYHG